MDSPFCLLGRDLLQALDTQICLHPEKEKVFTSVKRALVSAPALGLPDYRVASGVLTQKLGPHRRPVAYYSTQLGAVIKGTPGCIRARAATAALIGKTRPLNRMLFMSRGLGLTALESFPTSVRKVKST
uniref:Reverse transcriptase/retrotransposon-derived protein RNase H-like domain-containing protein n=1 Tax=Apteryx owenii TaxID=8824 RepID=A0A8B9P7K6_APTOW